jgi:hypothetical protein
MRTSGKSPKLASRELIRPQRIFVSEKSRVLAAGCRYLRFLLLVVLLVTSASS